MALVGTPLRPSSTTGVSRSAWSSYADQGRARVMRRERRPGAHLRRGATAARLIGAEMFGPRVEHTAHLLAWAVQSGLTVDDALAMPFYHPVIEEGIRTALRDLCTNLALRPPERPADLECGPGA